MFASMPMYDRPELYDAHRHYWDLIRSNLEQNGIDAPSTLSQASEGISHWLAPDLVFSQTCGMPYRNFLHGKVHLVGTPVYDLPDCPSGHYFSALVVRTDDLRTSLAEYDQARFAYNMEISQSGFAAPLIHAARVGVSFPNRIETHAHIKSAEMVASGQADIAAIDAVTWALIQRYDGFATKLKVLERTTPTTPTLPYITSLSHNPGHVFEAVEQAINDLPQDMRDALLLKGIMKIPTSDYLAVPNPK